MRKNIIKLLTVLCALFAYQRVSAQEVLFEHTFEWGMEGFSVEGYNGAGDDIWGWMFMQHAVIADAYGKITEPVENRLVSPQITLKDNNVASFSSTAVLFPDVANEIAFSVREVGGTWTDIQLPVVDNEGNAVMQDINIPAGFNGKTVEIGFKYTSQGSNSSGTWAIKNFVVKAGGSAPVEKVDPAISFDVTEYNYKVGEAFFPPVLNNPNNVSVTYSSSDETVATVDVLGNVSVNAEGTTTIKAVSAETDKFLAGEASYVLTISKTGEGGGGQGGAVENIFEAAFENDACGFYVEGDNGADDNIWQWRNKAQDMYADAYGKISGPLENYLVSPEMTLGTDNVVSFSSTASCFVNVAEDVALGIREVGGAWTDIKLPVVDNMGSVISQEITVPAEFNGKKVQIGFKYTSVASFSSGMWYIDNVVVKGTKSGDAPAEKADPELSFAQDTYNFYFDHSSFDGVALNNPNNLEVVYSIENNDYSVADVEPYTGKVWIYNYGTVVITATSAETDEFKEGKASYTLVVSDIPTGIEGITADDLENGKIYDLQGRRVNKLTKGVFIVNGKKVIVR